jgi:hypothetical protein
MQKQKQIQTSKMNLDSLIVSYTHINFKWIIDLNIRVKAMKLPEGVVGENPWDLGLSKDIF